MIQKFSAYGCDLIKRGISEDSGGAPINADAWYDAIIGPYSKKIKLAKKQPKPVKRLAKSKKVTVVELNDVIPDIHVESGKNPAAVALGRLGGLKGGKARAEKLTSDRRQEIAKLAADKRWGKK
jgi:hypothetical protein